ncbi:FAD NAD-P-binding domain-containing protein [Lentinula edodes]|uniref:FAD NAD-P-binding domain-containing protein n=1 Tax=Lentinula edodes TaxID=5353 RepID=A0A1Q3DV17_LENED|nr:FAD NAD-P-binding domain-containing protein [Lentinula edodes]
MSGSALGSLCAQDIAQAWLTDFSRSLSTGDCQTATSAFLKDGWLRDILVFTWNNRSLFGTSKIMKYLEENLERDTLSDFRLNDESHLAPYNNQSLPTAVSSGFTFRTPIAFGQGFVNLSQDESGNWKALTVLMMMKDLIGHEESGPEEGVYEGHTRAWVDVNEERRKAVEENPHVIILGDENPKYSFRTRRQNRGSLAKTVPDFEFTYPKESSFNVIQAISRDLAYIYPTR